MSLFRSLQKSAFWSPLLLGMLAILSFSEERFATEDRDTSIVSQQAFYIGDFADYSEPEQAAFLFFQPGLFAFSLQQAVEFCEFLVKPYRLLSVTQPPIRAGPVV